MRAGRVIFNSCFHGFPCYCSHLSSERSSWPSRILQAEDLLAASGDLNGMNERTGALPRSLGTRNEALPGRSQRKDSTDFLTFSDGS